MYVYFFPSAANLFLVTRARARDYQIVSRSA